MANKVQNPETDIMVETKGKLELFFDKNGNKLLWGLIIVGFALMAGEPCTTEFNPDVFSFRRITLAPIICMLGFFGMIVAIMIKKK